MVFKADWEKTQQRYPIAGGLLESIIYSQIEASLVEDYQLLSGGCANWNIKVMLTSGELLLFRIYIRDPAAAIFEKALYQYLKEHHIPVPTIKSYFQYEGYTVSIMEYMEGRTLRDVLLEYKRQGQLYSLKREQDIANIMYDLGSILKQLRGIKIEGEIEDILKHHGDNDALQNFVAKILADKNFQQVFPAKIQREIKEFLKIELHLLEEAEGASLVHGDYDPANILVDRVEGELKLVAILDWEFAHLGMQIWDVANMLRYQQAMPSIFESEFLRGLYGVATIMPCKLDKQISLCNLISLLDCLQRTDIKKCPNQVEDTRNLVTHILQ